MNEEGKSIKLHPFVLASFATANVHGKKGYKILDDQTPSSFHLIPVDRFAPPRAVFKQR